MADWSGWQTHRRCPCAIIWFYERLKKDIAEIEEAFQQYRISEALMTAYKLFWDEFSSWYLEIIKPSPGNQLTSVP